MKFIKTTKQNVGASLVELIIYVGLLGIILTVVYQLFSLVAIGKVGQITNDEIYLSAQRIMADISNEVKLADKINTPLMGNRDGKLIIDDGAVVYSTDSAGRLIKEKAGQTAWISDRLVMVEKLTFSLVGPSSTQSSLLVDFDLRGVMVGNNYLRQSFRSAVSLRRLVEP